jgi:hypothetical protein
VDARSAGGVETEKEPTMYDEFERAVNGRSRVGPSLLGWVFLIVAILFVVGMAGMGLAAFYVHRQVEQFASGVVRQFQKGPAEMGAVVLAGLESHSRLLDADPVEGLAFLRNLPQDGSPEAGILDLASLDLAALGRASGARETEVVRDRSGWERAGRAGGDDVSVSLRGDRDGGYLVIRGRDGHVRFDLTRDEDGGSLVVDSNEGRVRFDLRRGDDGGELVVETEEGIMRFGAGDRAQALPRWVPRLGGIPSEPRSVYSLTSQEGFLGAVAWEGREPPAEVLATYRRWLEKEGYELQMEHRLKDGDRDQGSLWARQEDQKRVVFLVADEDRSGTRVLLGYGEGK